MRTINETKSYKEFFEEDIYYGFVNYLVNNLGSATVIAILRDKPLISRKGVHPELKLHFNKFMEKRPKVLKRFIEENQKCLNMRNITGGDLRFPVNTSDEGLMVREDLRTPQFIPVDFKDAPRASKKDKYFSTFSNNKTVVRKEGKYLLPKRLTVHFKDGYGSKIGKTTESFMVNSRAEALDIILERYENKVAYATIQNEEQFVFVKPKNGKTKRSRKLRGKVQ